MAHSWLLELSHCVTTSWLAGATQTNFPSQDFMSVALPVATVQFTQAWDWLTVYWIAHSGAWFTLQDLDISGK